MKNIIIIAFVFIGVYFTHYYLSGNKSFLSLGSHISIAEIIKNPSTYTDSTLELNTRVLESTTFFNYTISTISDKDGSTIELIGNKPYTVGNEINIKAHLYVLYKKQGKQCAVLVEDDFKMLKSFFNILEKLLI